MSVLLRDLRYAARALARTPLFTGGIIVTLALGIGVNAAMFGVVDTLFFRPPAGVADAGHVARVYVRRTDPFFGTNTGGIGVYPAFADIRGTGAFAQVAAVYVRDLSLGRGAAAREVRTAAVSAAYFPLLGVRPGHGRLFVPADDQAGADRVAVITHAFWQRQFGGAADAIGRTLQLGGHLYTVVGVAPERFAGIDLQPVDVFLPIEAAADEFVDPRAITSRDYWWMDAIARLPDAAGAADRAAARATVAYRNGMREDRPRDSTAAVLLGPIQEARGPQAGREAKVSAWVAAVALVVLLIACANVANLLLARGVARRRELAVRAGLGAGRLGLARIVLAESVVLAAAGGAAALLLASWTGAAARAFLIPDLPPDTALVDTRVLAFTLAAVLVTALLTGLVPAIQVSRTDFAAALKSGGRGATARGGRTRAALLVLQVALTLVLLVGAGLFVRSLRNVQSIDLGFDADKVLEARVGMAAVGLEGRQANDTYLRLLERVRRVPGVAHAAATIAPFGWGYAVTMKAEGLDSIPRPSTGGPYISVVTPDYFATLGTRLLGGRVFSDGDAAGAPPVAVVSDAMARTLYPTASAIGKCLYVGSDTTTTCTQIVGIVANARRGSVVGEPELLYFIPFAQSRGIWNGGDVEIKGLVVRATGSADAVAAAVQRELQADGDLPYASVQSLADRIAPQLRSWRLGAAAFTAFGALALLIAAMGIFAVISYTVSRRTQEIGVRMALGAEAAQVARMILGQGLRAAAIGVVLGAAGAWALGRGIRSLLYEVGPADPLVFVGTAAVIVAVAALAAWLPARRAARVDPMMALRCE